MKYGGGCKIFLLSFGAYSRSSTLSMDSRRPNGIKFLLSLWTMTSLGLMPLKSAWLTTQKGQRSNGDKSARAVPKRSPLPRQSKLSR